MWDKQFQKMIFSCDLKRIDTGTWIWYQGVMTSVNTEKIGDICRRHKVRALFLFGSGRTNPDSARDFDFLVDFDRMSPAEHANEYFGLMEDLENILGKRVDLVETGAIKNPFFRKEVENTKVRIYEAA